MNFIKIIYGLQTFNRITKTSITLFLLFCISPPILLSNNNNNDSLKNKYKNCSCIKYQKLANKEFEYQLKNSTQLDKEKVRRKSFHKKDKKSKGNSKRKRIKEKGISKCFR